MKRKLPIVLLALFVNQPATAHLVSTRFGELYSGLLHPLTTLAHLVPWIGLGLLGALQGPRVARWSLVVFPIAVFFGLGVAVIFPGMSGFLWSGHLSFLLIGILVAFAASLGQVGFIAIAAAVGVCHGYANYSAELSGYPLWLYAVGVALSAYVLTALVTATAQSCAELGEWGKVAIRALGSWVAAAGAVHLGVLALAGP